MANSFNIPATLEIAAVKTVVDANKVILLDVQGTKITGIISEINDNEAKIDTTISEIALVKAKTNLIPQNVRGTWDMVQLSTTSDTLVDLLNVSGHGKLIQLVISVDNTADTIEFIVTLDGTAFDAISHTGDVTNQHIVPSCVNANMSNRRLFKIANTGLEGWQFNIEFESSLLIQIRRSAGTADSVSAKCYYTLDDF